MMEPYPPYTDVSHDIPRTSTSEDTFISYGSSLPAENHFLATSAAQFPFQPAFEEPKSYETPGSMLTPQPPWWRNDNSSFSAYIPQEYPAFSDHLSPWNSGISTISDPQSPRSSHSGSLPGMSCTVTPAFRQEDVHLSAFDNTARFPSPTTPLTFDNSIALPKPHGFDMPLEQRSPYEYDFNPWSGSQSDRNVTPEQQWPSPPSAEQNGFLQPVRKSKSRPQSFSRAMRKATEKRPTSAPGRNRRRRGTSNPKGTEGATQTFVCSFAPYGCESTFVSKNEWKRHVTSQHLQLGFFRCDVGKCNVHQQSSHPSHSPNTSSNHSQHVSPLPGQPNDFNRKDLFTQHQRRMHSPWHQPGGRRNPSDAEQADFEAGLEEIRQRCWHQLRHPPLQSQCVFCQEPFSGEGSWDVRMEHIGRHFERDDAASLSPEIEDAALREWGLREGILRVVDGRCCLTS